MRTDIYLFENGFAESRSKAADMIRSGIVYIDCKQVTKPSYDITGGNVEIKGAVMPYVGRGGLKLEHALDHFGIDVSGLTVADIGASTGGFTDCLLQRGAARVYAIDSGSGQLHAKLRSDSRVISMESFNARNLNVDDIGGRVPLAVMDVSFISQSALYGAVSEILEDNGVFISLIKPQFEVGRQNVGKNGIVKDKKLYQTVTNHLKYQASLHGLNMQAYTESPIKGGDGNTEFLALFVKAANGGREQFENDSYST